MPVNQTESNWFESFLNCCIINCVKVLNEPVFSKRQNLSSDKCLEDKRKDCRNHFVLYHVSQLCTVICTFMWLWTVLTGELGLMVYTFLCVCFGTGFLSTHSNRHVGYISVTVFLIVFRSFCLSAGFLITDISGVGWRRAMKFCRMIDLGSSRSSPLLVNFGSRVTPGQKVKNQ